MSDALIIVLGILAAPTLLLVMRMLDDRRVRFTRARGEKLDQQRFYVVLHEPSGAWEAQTGSTLQYYLEKGDVRPQKKRTAYRCLYDALKEAARRNRQ